MNRQVKLACKIGNQNWLEEQCQEIENLEKQHLTRQMPEKIRWVTNRRKTTQTTGIMDYQDNVVFEKEALLNIWMEYMEELYDDDRVTRPDIKDTIILLKYVFRSSQTADRNSCSIVSGYVSTVRIN